VFRGKCLCGDIEFQAEEVPGMVFNCHCTRCRKSTGSAFATQVFAQRSSLKFIKGKDKLTEYESTGGMRTFCSKCGSRLMNYGKGDVDYLSVAISSIEEPNKLRPNADCFLSTKLDWCEKDKGIESFDEFPEF
jgi:hypothetical protein